MPALAAATVRRKGIEIDDVRARKNLDDLFTFFKSAVPRLLFPYRRPIPFQLTLSPDGQRFALIEQLTSDSAPHVVVATNVLATKK